MEENSKPQKRVQVSPNTWIIIDADANEKEAINRFKKKHNLLPVLDEQQKRREQMTIRSNKVLQRTKYKK